VNSQPKALLFDIFGTVFDWRSSIVEEGEAWGKKRGVNVDWARFANAWRAGYRPALDRVRRGEIPFTKLDVLHRENLERLLPEFGLTGMTESDREYWNRVWHRLKPWPEATDGLARLRKRYTIAPLSNGNFSLLTALSKNAGICWDANRKCGLQTGFVHRPMEYGPGQETDNASPEQYDVVAADMADLATQLGA
jgi:2-haloacid dehalogenase